MVLQDRLARPGHPVVKEIRDPLVLREQLDRLARLVARDRQALRVLMVTVTRPLAPQA